MYVDNDALVGAVIGSTSILPTSAVGGAPFRAIVISIIDRDDTPKLDYQNYKFIQTEELTALGVAVHPYGAIVFDALLTGDVTEDTLVVVEFDGKQYGAALVNIIESPAATPITFDLIEDEGGGGDQGGST